MSSQDPINRIQISQIQESQIQETMKILTRAFNFVADDTRKTENDLRQRSWHDGIKPVTFVATCQDADGNQEIVGAVMCHGVLRQKNWFGISCLAVRDAFQRHGVGRSLMEAGEKFISQTWMKKKPGTIVLLDEIKKKIRSRVTMRTWDTRAKPLRNCSMD
jgi:predicted N-acetyltransferase YhbS